MLYLQILLHLAIFQDVCIVSGSSDEGEPDGAADSSMTAGRADVDSGVARLPTDLSVERLLHGTPRSNDAPADLSQKWRADSDDQRTRKQRNSDDEVPPRRSSVDTNDVLRKRWPEKNELNNSDKVRSSIELERLRLTPSSDVSPDLNFQGPSPDLWTHQNQNRKRRSDCDDELTHKRRVDTEELAQRRFSAENTDVLQKRWPDNDEDSELKRLRVDSTSEVPPELVFHGPGRGVWVQETVLRGKRFGPFIGKWTTDPIDPRYAWEVSHFNF